MTFTLREYQIKLLNLLLDKYESSKTFAGENRISQSFSEKPGKIFPAYDSDYTDLDLIRDFEGQMEELERWNLIDVRRGKRGIEKLTTKSESREQYYLLLKREDKKSFQKKQRELYEKYRDVHPILDAYCQEQIRRLEENKKSLYEGEEADRILRLCSFILTNQQEILERELSITVLSDSKLWEQKYRPIVCRILRRYGNYENILMGVEDGESSEEKRMVERIILAEHLVFANPSYVYFKGNAVFSFVGGKTVESCNQIPLAFSSDSLKNLEEIHILDEQVMTVENLTSFNRMWPSDTFLIFLSGYHNSAKQDLVRKMYEENPSLRWTHFGDMDPDGFYIVEHLKRGTGIDFEPVYMSKAYLEKYNEFTKPLTENDRKKAEQLLQNGKYCEIIKYMLDTGGKLEQEIISWMEKL